MKESSINRYLLAVFIALVLALLIPTTCKAQLYPNLRGVKIDSLASRGDTIFITNQNGSVARIFTVNNQLYFKDSQGTKAVASIGGGGGGGIPEAPIDGSTYGRNNAAWVQVTGGASADSVYSTLTAEDTLFIGDDQNKIYKSTSGLTIEGENSNIILGGDIEVSQRLESQNATGPFIRTQTGASTNQVSFGVDKSNLGSGFGGTDNLLAIVTENVVNMHFRNTHNESRLPLQLQYLSTNPTSPNNGWMYYNTTSNKFRFYEGGVWNEFGAGSGSADSVLQNSSDTLIMVEETLYGDGTNGSTEINIKAKTGYFTDSVGVNGTYVDTIVQVEDIILPPITAEQYKLSALNSAPASASATGTLGEIRITSDYIYICVATDTWVRVAITTW